MIHNPASCEGFENAIRATCKLAYGFLIWCCVLMQYTDGGETQYA